MYADLFSSAARTNFRLISCAIAESKLLFTAHLNTNDATIRWTFLWVRAPGHFQCSSSRSSFCPPCTFRSLLQQNIDFFQRVCKITANKYTVWFNQRFLCTCTQLHFNFFFILASFSPYIFIHQFTCVPVRHLWPTKVYHSSTFSH